MHRHMYTATYRTVCYGWRVGIVKSIVIVIATAAPDCDLTLPYLTLLHTSSLLYYITLDEPISDCQSAPKTHESSVLPRKNGSTVEVTLGGSMLTWPQWPTPGAHQMLAGLAFQAYSGQNSPLMRSTTLSNTFIPHAMQKQWNH